MAAGGKIHTMEDVWEDLCRRLIDRTFDSSRMTSATERYSYRIHPHIQ
jgi:hypothetical protein